MYIQGWKNAASFLGVCDRTLKNWHYKYLKIPWDKDSNYQASRVRIPEEILDLWYQKVKEIRRDLKR